jgi:hypothetical protein
VLPAAVDSRLTFSTQAEPLQRRVELVVAAVAGGNETLKYSSAVPAPFTRSICDADPKAERPVPPLAIGSVPVTSVAPPAKLMAPAMS